MDNTDKRQETIEHLIKARAVAQTAGAVYVVEAINKILTEQFGEKING